MYLFNISYVVVIIAILECHHYISRRSSFISLLQKDYDIDIDCRNTDNQNGRQRMVGMDPNFMATFKGTTGYFQKAYKFWGEQSGRFKWGLDLISEQNVGFHNLRYPAFMLRIHAIFYKDYACPKDSQLVQGLNEIGFEVENFNDYHIAAVVEDVMKDDNTSDNDEEGAEELSRENLSDKQDEEQNENEVDSSAKDKALRRRGLARR